MSLTLAESCPEKDMLRLKANSAAYAKALAGDEDAATYLIFRSGRYGICPVNGYGEVGGWGSEVARRDAWIKAQELLVVAGGGR